MITTLPNHCWELHWPDGSVFDGGNDGAPHFDTEDDSAEEANDRTASWPDMYPPGSLVPTRLDAPCFTVVCDGCGRTTDSDSFSTMHYPGPAEAKAEAREFDFFVGVSGDAWCEDCKVLKAHAPVGRATCLRCGVDVDEHEAAEVPA